MADAGCQEQSTCPLPPRPRSQQESLTGSCAESSNITQSFSVNSARLFFCTGRAFVGQPRACTQSRFRGSPTCAVSTLPGSSPQLPSRPTLFSVLFFRPYFRSSGDPGCRPAAWALKFFRASMAPSKPPVSSKYGAFKTSSLSKTFWSRSNFVLGGADVLRTCNRLAQNRILSPSKFLPLPPFQLALQSLKKLASDQAPGRIV